MNCNANDPVCAREWNLFYICSAEGNLFFNRQRSNEPNGFFSQWSSFIRRKTGVQALYVLQRCIKAPCSIGY